ncbi:MAG TPA: hypothetical protein DIT18_14260 [Pseudomonas sp.]|nr:hypothetical protein [Pseudomonas sp.]
MAPCSFPGISKKNICEPCNPLGRPYVWVTARFLGISHQTKTPVACLGKPRPATPEASTRRYRHRPMKTTIRRDRQ